MLDCTRYRIIFSRVVCVLDSDKSSEIYKAVADLRWANALVLVYPTWWFNFPATLKGYFDRVFLPVLCECMNIYVYM